MSSIAIYEGLLYAIVNNMIPKAGCRQERAPFTYLMAALVLLSGATGIVTAESTADSTAASWTLTLNGVREETVSADAFREIKAGDGITYTASDGSSYTGVPLKLLIGMVDDADPATFNATRAAEGYSIIIRATDWHDRIFSPSDLTDTGFCVADSVNGGLLPKQDGDIKIAPLILVGEDVPPGMGIGNIMDITLTGAAITGETEDAVSLWSSGTMKWAGTC